MDEYARVGSMHPTFSDIIISTVALNMTCNAGAGSLTSSKTDQGFKWPLFHKINAVLAIGDDSHYRKYHLVLEIGGVEAMHNL